MATASLKFDGCISIPSFERDEGLRSELVAKFRLCQDGNCGSCRHSGEYIVEMREFVESYQEAMQEANEAACENANYACETSCQYGNYNANNNANGENNYNYNNNNN